MVVELSFLVRLQMLTPDVTRYEYHILCLPCANLYWKREARLTQRTEIHVIQLVTNLGPRLQPLAALVLVTSNRHLDQLGNFIAKILGVSEEVRPRHWNTRSTERVHSSLLYLLQVRHCLGLDHNLLSGNPFPFSSFPRRHASAFTPRYTNPLFPCFFGDELTHEPSTVSSGIPPRVCTHW